jgi:hypothetical protein
MGSKVLSYSVLGILVISGLSKSALAVRSDLKRHFAASIIQRNYRDHRVRKACRFRKVQMALTQANDENSPLLQMPDEILVLIASRLNPNGLGRMACSSRRLARIATDDHVRNSIEPWPGFAEFDAQFVTIPNGFLPDDPNEIASFETGAYPAVTEELWQEMMGSLPTGYKAKGPNYPITHVNWENKDGSPAEVQEFLAKLNNRTAYLDCTYDLPTDRELQYLFRGDETGKNTAQFMMAKDQDGSPLDVNGNNCDDYIWHTYNSNTGSRERRIQPSGTKKVNAFGIERPSVQMMSKDMFDVMNAGFGRSTRGCSWQHYPSGLGESRSSSFALAGRRVETMGFPLVRRCTNWH